MSLSEYQEKVNKFEYEMLNFTAIKNKMTFIINEGILPYNNFTDYEWKNGNFYHYKNDIFEIWCNAYNRGRMSYIVKYHYRNAYISDYKIVYDRMRVSYFNIPSFENDKETELKTAKYYFNLICDEINKSLISSYKEKPIRKMPFRIAFDDTRVHDVVRDIEIFGNLIYCNDVNNENFSELDASMNDLSYIKLYMDVES